MKRTLFFQLAILTLAACGNNQNANTQAAAQIEQEDAVEVLYFHGKQRCITCNAIERLTKEVTFANGLRPADSVETGTAFFALLPPLEGGFPEQVQAEVLPL